MKLNVFLLEISLILMFSSCGKSEEITSEHKGYSFVYNDNVIEIDAEAAPVIKELGEAESYFEAASCIFEGIDKMYAYKDFEIDTYPMNEVDYISAVIFKDDSITTAEGIRIGDSVDKMTEIYGVGNDVGGMFVYEKCNVKLCFIIKDGSVASIEYRSAVLGK